MSNPSITRLGINQFWYKHWISDLNYSQNLQQDKLLTLLIKLYFDYGLSHKSNIFVHEYWYKFNNSKRIKLQSEFRAYNSFFRRFFYSNDVVGIEHTFLLRNKTPEYFPMNLWLFKYMNWVIISVNWFKPLKQKTQKHHSVASASAINTITKFSSPKNLKKRLKLVYLYFLQLNKNSKSYYF